MGNGFDRSRLARMDRILASHTERGEVPGLAWGVARHGAVHLGAAGNLAPGEGPGVAVDTIFRIASMTKPVTAAAALMLVEDCVLRLDGPLDDLLPELARVAVLRTPSSEVDDTVPRARALTLRDLLTFRMGHGFDFAWWEPQPLHHAMAAAGIGAGPPRPQEPPGPDEWMSRLGRFPLQYQPGQKWLYHVGADVLGVVVSRAAGRPFEEVLAERIFEPLGMVDTAFWVPASSRARFGPAFQFQPEDRTFTTYDVVDGEWASPPAFPSGGGGLVSTVTDFLAFAGMLMAGGTHDGRRLLARPFVEAMTTDQLTEQQKVRGGPDPHSDDLGWGFCVSVQIRQTGPAAVGTYGWNGGLGSIWSNDPRNDLTVVLLTNRLWESPVPPAVCRDALVGAYAALDD
jgi:CubicO group peptidase (beta-lactamase class C family)